jgi:hypothetical protein
MEKVCTNKNHSYKHNEQINKQNINNSECFGVKYVKIFPEMTSQYFFFLNIVLVTVDVMYYFYQFATTCSQSGHRDLLPDTKFSPLKNMFLLSICYPPSLDGNFIMHAFEQVLSNASAKWSRLPEKKHKSPPLANRLSVLQKSRCLKIVTYVSINL